MVKNESDAMVTTKYEMAQMIGARALQISMGAPFAVKLSDEQLSAVKYNPIEIAKIEYAKGSIPMRTIRPKHTNPEQESITN